MVFRSNIIKFKVACWFSIYLLASFQVIAQVPNLKTMMDAVDPPKPTTTSEGNADETSTRLNQWQKEARETLAKLEDTTQPSNLPTGITSAEVEERRRNVEQTILSITRYLKSLDVIAEETKDLESSRAEAAAWNGFKEAPPFSILMLDELLNEHDAMAGKLSSLESSMVVFQRALTNIANETKAHEDATKRLPVDGDDAAKWRLDAARAKSRLLMTRASLIQSNCEILQIQIDATKVELALLDRKTKIAKAGARFSAEDLEKIKVASTERKATYTKENEAIVKRQKAAELAQKQEQAALDALVAKAAEGTEPPGLELAKFRLLVASDRNDSLDSISEAYENYIQLEDLNFSAYQERQNFLGASTKLAREQSLTALNQLWDRLKPWDIFIENEIAAVSADLSKLDSQYASSDASDPRAGLLVEQRKIKSEKLLIYQRISKSVQTQLRLISRWVGEFTPEQDRTSIVREVSGTVTKFWEAVKSIWSFEVTSSERKMEVDGQVLTLKVPVTLGTLLQGLIFFSIGYALLARVATRIQGGIIRRGHIAEAQAKTLRNWAMIVVAVFLAVGTLNILNVPITIFAFFGGALAIGLGFGSQTLIKNFISGIIVLFERKIRVGDIVDVGGISGTISEINTRSSVLRGADGKETLVPNSYFLENRITNLTLSNRRVRRMLTLRMEHGTSPQSVTTILKECIDRHGLILKEPAPVIIFEDVTETAYVFTSYYWTEFNDKTNSDLVGSDLFFMLEKRFSETELSFAGPTNDFPISTKEPLKLEWVKREKDPVK